ncbi:DUF5133 domain-containing protein [Streptomyces sp. MNP-20]|uniref:DUF5133 domain-containing protein n=1 Tax=Streptomyces sp. MNP-20 TaxID=2721165 RepID=UPI002815BC48|nr:DUF5133 domain-containing protein [Streptomyces sp. MNP-20]
MPAGQAQDVGEEGVDTVLMPDPRTLRVMLARYADLRIAAPPTEAARRALEDVSYTLCVLTGVTRVDDALRVADALLAEAGRRTGRPGAASPRAGVEQARPASPRAGAPGVPGARPGSRAGEFPLPRPSAAPEAAPESPPPAEPASGPADDSPGDVSLAV